MNTAELIATELLAGQVPMMEADYRAHILRTVIIPQVEGWGFEPRFCRELPTMHPEQLATYNALNAKMTCRGAIVALLGPRGLGKTTLAAQFALRAAWRNHEESLKADGSKFRPHVIYKKLTALVSRYKPLFTDAGSIHAEALENALETLCRQEFLVVDELQDGDDIRVKNRILADIVDRRYAACRDTILIANYPDASAFAAATGDSVVSRLTEHGAIITCNWPSYRIQ